MKNLTTLVFACMLIFSAGIASALDCNGPFWDDQQGKLRWCTEQEKQQQYQQDQFEKERFDTEIKKLAEKKERESSVRLVAIAMGVVAVLIALIMGFGIVGSLGWGAVFGFGPLMFSLPIGIAFFLVGVIAVLFGFWQRSESRKDRLFECNLDAMTYFRDGLKINVDMERHMVIVNGSEVAPSEYSYSEHSISKKVSYNTGGYQAVTGPGAAAGSWETKGHVYVPGESGSYHESVGLEVKIKKTDSIVASAKFTLHKDAKASSDALLKVLAKVQAWCDEAKKGTALNTLDSLCQQAGMESDYFNKSYWDNQGVLRWAIAVDRNGKAVAVYDEGAVTWIGTLKAASAQIIDNKLEVKVDDAAYRNKHVTERRFMILEKQPREVLVEWEDRINLLAKKASESA